LIEYQLKLKEAYRVTMAGHVICLICNFNSLFMYGVWWIMEDICTVKH